MLCPERALVKIRPDMPLDRAALIGCGETTDGHAPAETPTISKALSIQTTTGDVTIGQ